MDGGLCPPGAKTTFTTGGYSRPAAPVHLCKKPDIRKMLQYRGCTDEDGGKTRLVLEVGVMQQVVKKMFFDPCARKASGLKYLKESN